MSDHQIVYWVMAAGILLPYCATALFRWRRRSQKLRTPEEKKANNYSALRAQILNWKCPQASSSTPDTPSSPCAVVMDWAVTTGVATVVAVSDGSASIYYSSGGGSIGGGTHGRPFAMQRCTPFRPPATFWMACSWQTVFLHPKAEVWSFTLSQREESSWRERRWSCGAKIAIPFRSLATPCKKSYGVPLAGNHCSIGRIRGDDDSRDRRLCGALRSTTQIGIPKKMSGRWGCRPLWRGGWRVLSWKIGLATSEGPVVPLRSPAAERHTGARSLWSFRPPGSRTYLPTV